MAQYVVVERGPSTPTETEYRVFGPFEDRFTASKYAQDFKFSRWTTDVNVSKLSSVESHELK